MLPWIVEFMRRVNANAGANRSLLRKTHIIEFSALGLISGLLAVVISEAIIYALYTQVMIWSTARLYLWPVIPATGALCVGIAGCWV